MNTNSWGSRMWSYIHLVAQYYSEGHGVDKDAFKFFDILKYVLPCIYCRNSYTEFVKELPPLKSAIDSQWWLYNLHNKVNDKLRKQELLFSKDPSFRRIYLRYSKILNDIDIRRDPSNMWYSLFTIAFNYDPEKHNKQKYKEFYQLALQKTVPYGNKYYRTIVKALKKHPINRQIFASENTLTRWLYNVYCYVNTALNISCQNFGQLSYKFNKIRANCAVKTCKLSENNKRCSAMTKKHRRCQLEVRDGKFCHCHIKNDL
jgi:hypothetical protein